MKRRFILTLMLILATTLTLSGCKFNWHSNSRLSREQKRISSRAGYEVGFPAITNFQQMREYKMIYEDEDKPTPTYTYLKDRYGHLHLLCNSIGYGIPYSTQYTNPDYLQYTGGRAHRLPLADPDGLYHSQQSSGTWVICVNPKTKKDVPVYSEPNIVTSPFPLSLQTNN